MIVRRSCFAFGVILAAAGLATCQPADRGQSAEEGSGDPAASATAPYVVEYAARDYVFVGPAEIPSGWVTIRMANEGLQHHFVSLTLLP